MATCQKWYKILRLKKTEVIVQLTARSISHSIIEHHMTLKSKLYQSIKNFVESLRSQFNALVGNNWTEALRTSGKTFKNFKKDLLRKFHPDVNNGSTEATEICQEINGWEEPVDYQAIIEEVYQQRCARWASKGDFTINPLSDEYYMRGEVAQYMMAIYGYEYDFTTEPWYVEYDKQRRERWQSMMKGPKYI